MKLHAWPYVIWMLALWTIILKRFLMLRIVSIIPWYWSVWVVMAGISALINYSHLIPNLYGARLWEKVSWLPTVVVVNGRFYLFFFVLGPIIVHAILGERKFKNYLRTVEVVVCFPRSIYRQPELPDKERVPNQSQHSQHSVIGLEEEQEQEPTVNKCTW